MIEVKRNNIFFNGTRMTRILRICANFLFNPHGVNDHICYHFYSSLCPTGNKFFLLSSSRLTVLQSYSPTVFQLMTND